MFIISDMLLIVCILVITMRIASSSDGDLLTRSPFVMSHDSASGEIVEDRDHVVADWTRTQSVGLVGQLDCGTRAFDYRPYYKDGELYAHHGPVVIYKTMRESIREIQTWNSQNPNELVILYLSHFDGDDGCKDAAIAFLASMNVSTVVDCNDLSSLTVGEAKYKSSLPNGGYLFSISDCMEEYFDSTINCYGSDFVCYDSWPENTSSIPWNKLKEYMTMMTASYPDSSNMLWMAQAHWQSTALSVSLGTLHNSSIILDEERSGVNSWLVGQIKNKAYPCLNMIEVDNVCDHGLELYQTLNNLANH
jgi:hypothetical protein